MTTPVVLITGALTGIGRATALAFARDRARVVVSGRSDEEGQKLTHPTDPYKSPVVSPRTGNAGSTLIGCPNCRRPQSRT